MGWLLINNCTFGKVLEKEDEAIPTLLLGGGNQSKDRQTEEGNVCDKRPAAYSAPGSKAFDQSTNHQFFMW